MSRKGNALVTLGWLAAVGVGLWWITRKTTAAKRSELINWAPSQPGDNASFVQALGKMTDSEIDAVYSFIFDYYTKNLKLAPGGDLYNAINAISAKYNIFT